MKKLFITLLFLSTTAINTSGNKPKSALEGDKNVRLINSALALTPDAGAHVESIKDAGKCALGTIRALKSVEDKKLSELKKMRDELLKQCTDNAAVMASISSTKALGSRAVETEKELEDQIVKILKAKLIVPRQEFFGILLEYSSILRGPVEKSLNASKRLDSKNSKILSFMNTKVSETDHFFENHVSTKEDLEGLCAEFTTFCSDFWRALSPNLMRLHKQYISQQKKNRGITPTT